MNVPVPQSLDLQQVNAAVIALKQAIDSLEERVKELESANVQSH